MSNQPSLLEPPTPKKKQLRSLNTSELMVLLRARYPKDQYAFFKEVPNATGFKCNRHADALTMSLWPSRGLHLTGFELKISRSDWLKELNTPSKAEAIAQFCNYWYLVAGKEEIVQAGELPPNWGLMVPDGDKLKVVKEAKELEAKELTREFIAALFRAAQENIGIDAEVQRARAEGYKQGVETGESRAEYRIQGLVRKIEGFENAAGVRLEDYNGGSLAAALELVKRNAVGNLQQTFRMMRQDAEGIIKIIDDALKEQANANPNQS